MSFYFDRSNRRIPEYLSDCTRFDRTSSELFDWSEKVERWANTVFWINIIVGLLAGIVILCIEWENLWWVAFVLFIVFVLIGIVSYFLLHVISILIESLASLVHNTDVIANVALLEASVNPEISKQKPSPSRSSYTRYPSKSTQKTNRVCYCGKCGAVRHADDECCPKCQSAMKVYKDELL